MTALSFGDVARSAVDFLDRDRAPKPWRDSYDVDSPKAKPWQRFLDGSREAWSVGKNAVLRVCREDIDQQAVVASHARQDVKRLNERWERTVEDMERRGATADQMADARRRYAEELRAARPQVDRLRVGDDRVLERFLDEYNPQNCEVFTAQATIARKLGLSSPSLVNDALHRLRKHGYIDWVRRTVKTEGADGPQRKQTSNATFFDWKAKMKPRPWARFWQLVLAGLKRIGKTTLGTTVALFTRAVGSLKGEKLHSSKRPGPRLLRPRRRLSLIRDGESSPA